MKMLRAKNVGFQVWGEKDAARVGRRHVLPEGSSPDPRPWPPMGKSERSKKKRTKGEVAEGEDLSSFRSSSGEIYQRRQALQKKSKRMGETKPESKLLFWGHRSRQRKGAGSTR